MTEKIAVLGLGYVGLPVAVGFAEHFDNTVGFDINNKRVQALKQYQDWTGEVESDRLRQSRLLITDDPCDLEDATFYVACIPTPINNNNQPDLEPLHQACNTIGAVLKKGDIVVFESTVYPGLTEDVCGPWLAKKSGLKQGLDFALGYSPERINPGDKKNRLETITKIVSGDCADSTKRVTDAYKKIITQADLHIAPNIKVAEMAKITENTQRDINIAFMNEIALICEKMNISTQDVLKAARTKWNFLPFTPGLVGGHCIGVDPYYLTFKSEELGHYPEVILSGRRINDSMGVHIANKMIKMQLQNGIAVQTMRVGILGLTFKENVPDTRNSKVPDIIKELKEYQVETLVHDPRVNRDEIKQFYGIDVVDLAQLKDLDGLILAVSHQEFEALDIAAMLKRPGILIDVKSSLDRNKLPPDIAYWSL